MDMNSYQELAARTTRGDLSVRDALSMTGLGLVGETGECADLVKKHLYHGHDLDRDKLIKELGDVLWYVAVMSRTLSIPLEDIAEKNIAKLKARYPEGFSEQASQNRIE